MEFKLFLPKIYYFVHHSLTIDFSYINDKELHYLIVFFGRCENEFSFDYLEMEEIFRILKNLCIDERAARHKNQAGRVIQCDLSCSLLALSEAQIMALKSASARMASKPGDRHYFGESLSRLFDEVEDDDYSAEKLTYNDPPEDVLTADAS